MQATEEVVSDTDEKSLQEEMFAFCRRKAKPTNSADSVILIFCEDKTIKEIRFPKKKLGGTFTVV